jgi:hypothetical protein
MTLLAKTVAAEMAKQADKKVALHFSLQRIDARLLKDVGKLVGITAPKSIIREAFLVASCFAARENMGILDYVRFDRAQAILKLVERKDAPLRKAAKAVSSAVSVLRWNLLVLANILVDDVQKAPRSTEEIVSAVLELCHTRLSQLFSGNGELRLGKSKGGTNGVA